MLQRVNEAKYPDHAAREAQNANGSQHQAAKLSAIQSALHFQMGYAPQQPLSNAESAENSNRNSHTGHMLILGVGATPGRNVDNGLPHAQNSTQADETSYHH